MSYHIILPQAGLVPEKTVTERIDDTALDYDVICNDISSVKNGFWIQELRTKKIFLTDIQENAGPIEALLGADVAGKLVTDRREELETGLVVLETKLGWTLMKYPDILTKKMQV
ncbi:uncharacterized protein CEXT_440801 [Caerostris extrusa]|uniref:Uncharacterized protein n=1 Tax=Caerostris extrusa TaxID=172846 RepID=A0AAV4R3G6_CAEEX|nr:uncharacterized protein CEXT_440801 [Caerostris extrusa]